ncbi:hypothetical protein BN7_4598 [Wickerhamomyces ciferrii]|uniref:Uncharacterized protein n=1 Tax=Wickerhamomyces ciferrii (strain ATCC 14091 / BCRC 22168 / CBS 111 / JCM 3599 / NBRC 0793 / NRRL Y-1031 F-60-10) TaxID=1206466 RepID=K0KUB0_WICCF|nr:uncharacterized protein BN7_4598 [Wickerhamomyces ciferrii]CCH45019.1 hypothetical protein BN7_4598 [Wickerhamomyces ciferrii]
MVTAIKNFEYDLKRNSILMEDTIVNVESCFVKSRLYDFKLQDLFKIHQKNKLETEADYYVDVEDTEKLCEAIDELRYEFCNPRLLDIIEDKVDFLPDTNYPKYYLGIWYIAFEIDLLIQWPPSQTSHTKDSSTSSEQAANDNSKFTRGFKLLEFDNVKELRKDDFKANFYQLEYFIKQSLMKFDHRKITDILNELLFNCIKCLETSSSSYNPEFQDTEEEMNFLQEGFNTSILKPLLDFFNGLINVHCGDPDNSSKFLKSGNIPATSPSKILKEISTETGEGYPSDLINFPLFNGSEDISVKLRVNQGSVNCFGAQMLDLNHSNKFDPSTKFKGLNTVFRKSLQYILPRHYTHFMLTNFIKTLYFEFPVSTGGVWNGDDPNHVILKKEPLYFFLFDNSKVRDPDKMSLQAMLALQVFDIIRKIMPENIISFKGMDQHIGASYRVIDESTDVKFGNFSLDLMKNGFKKKQGITRKSSKRGNNEDCLNKIDYIPASQNTKAKKISNKRFKKSNKFQRQPNCKLNQYLDGIFDLQIQMETKDFEVLVDFTNASSFKLFVSSKEFLNKITIRDQYKDYALSDQVFCKIYDTFQLKDLFSYSSRISGSKDFDDVQLNIMNSLEDIKDIDEWINHDMKRHLFKEIIALKRIESWNSMNDESNQINTAKLLQYGWFDDLTLGNDKYSLFGPFMIFEKIDFINDNEISSLKREESFNKQVELLKKAGITHGDLENKYNYCFNSDGKCFIVDFDMSTVDNDSILENVFDNIDFWPPEDND